MAVSARSRRLDRPWPNASVGPGSNASVGPGANASATPGTIPDPVQEKGRPSVTVRATAPETWDRSQDGTGFGAGAQK